MVLAWSQDLKHVLKVRKSIKSAVKANRTRFMHSIPYIIRAINHISSGDGREFEEITWGGTLSCLDVSIRVSTVASLKVELVSFL